MGEGTSIVGGRFEELDPRCARTPLDLVLIEDLTDAASDLSGTDVLASEMAAVEDLGLSLPVFGILDLIAERIDLDDSFVSERLKEG